MDFPDAKRVIYQRNPLVEVVCQLRFPRQLSLAERLPAEFQEKLGPDYPFVELREILQFSLSTEETPPSKFTHYDFLPEDRSIRVTLTSEFLAVSTDRYERWELFEEHVQAALRALLETYSIPFFSRIGLRYVDVISREALEIPDTRWSDLIRHSALGLLAEDEMPVEDVVELTAATVVDLSEGGKATLRTALGKHERTGDETVFIIDGDFFVNEARIKGANDAIAICRRFNKVSGRAFRWLIRDELDQRLDPQDP